MILASICVRVKSNISNRQDVTHYGENSLKYTDQDAINLKNTQFSNGNHYSPEDFDQYKSLLQRTIHRPISNSNDVKFPKRPSQSFNVGYSVSFENNLKKIPRHTFDNSEIITGSHKEFVNKPTSGHNPGAFFRNDLPPFHSKFQKQFTQNYNPGTLSQQENLSPGTSQFVHDAKTSPVYASEQQFEQDKRGSQWRTLNPNVDYYGGGGYLSRESKTFDHDKALGKSEDFDYNDVINTQNFKTSSKSHPNTPQESHGYEQPSVSTVEEQYDTSQTYKNPPKVKEYTQNHADKQLLQQHFGNNIDQTKLIDTSLLRDPDLTYTNFGAVNFKATPHIFDVKFLQNAASGNQVNVPQATSLQNAQVHVPNADVPSYMEHNTPNYNYYVHPEQNYKDPTKLHTFPTHVHHDFRHPHVKTPPPYIYRPHNPFHRVKNHYKVTQTYQNPKGMKRYVYNSQYNSNAFVPQVNSHPNNYFVKRRINM